MLSIQAMARQCAGSMPALAAVCAIASLTLFSWSRASAMLLRLFFIVYLLLVIVVINLWHHFARWFVNTQGMLPSLLLIGIILLASQLPYWGDD